MRGSGTVRRTRRDDGAGRQVSSSWHAASRGASMDVHSAAHKVVIRAGVEAHGAAASNRSGAIEHPSRPFQRLNLSTASNSGPR